jgi:hypothetical protein
MRFERRPSCYNTPQTIIIIIDGYTGLLLGLNRNLSFLIAYTFVGACGSVVVEEVCWKAASSSPDEVINLF